MEPAPALIPGRSLVLSEHGVAASSQPLAAQAGVQVMAAGGNAVDAAIAANAVQGLMEPMSNGIGGDLFAIVYSAADDALTGINASGWSPAEMTPQFLAARGVTDEIPLLGPFCVTVPGVVAGWTALHERSGRLPFAQVLAPAIDYAERGFFVPEITATLWASWADVLLAGAESAATFLVDGRPPRTGDRFRNPNLARTLRRIAEGGRDAYYRGAVAEAIVDTVRGHGGAMSADDLSAFEPEWVQPIETTYRGWTVSELPPNGQGIAALEMLNILETFPVAEYGFHSVRALHAMIEAKKLAYADLRRYVGDPRFGRIPVEELISKEHAVRRARLIDPSRAADPVAPGELRGGKDTIYLSVVDGEGNVVSLIQSNFAGFGSGLTPAGTGFMLHNRGALFTLASGHSNTLAGRKRPLHTIIPGFLRRGDLRIGFGIMGGWNQAQAHAQFVSHVVDFGMNLQQALEAGRFTKATFGGRDVEIEILVPEPTRRALRRLGHELVEHPPRTPHFGYGHATLHDRGRGLKAGAADPRHDGEAIPAPAPARRSDPQ